MISRWVQLCAVLLIVSIHGNLAEEKRRMKRIIGGDYAPPEKFPWALSIHGVFTLGNIRYIKACGATLISDTWLLTAAHCIYNTDEKGALNDLRDPSIWHITAGQVYVNHNSMEEIEYDRQLYIRYKGNDPFFRDLMDREMQEEREKKQNVYGHLHVKHIILHEKYIPGEQEYDIALMKLDRPLLLHKLIGVAAINLPSVPHPSLYPPLGNECVIVGWGCTDVEGSSTPKAKYVHLEVISNARCNYVYSHGVDLNNEHEFCAGFVNRRVGVCPGDSGSGLVCQSGPSNWTVAGVASSTHGLKPDSYPGIFTRVSFFVDWIQSNMKKY